jgi:hypothetical protein
MMRYYTNREISALLGINLARWKRWSRSFLPPDPLGGMQSGYARQYTVKDLFKVFLGGHLLGHLRLSVAESRQVLDDLTPWLKKAGFLRLDGFDRQLAGQKGGTEFYRIYFCARGAAKSRTAPAFRYVIRKTIGRDCTPNHAAGCAQETIVENLPVSASQETKALELINDPYVYLVNLTALYALLVSRVCP